MVETSVVWTGSSKEQSTRKDEPSILEAPQDFTVVITFIFLLHLPHSEVGFSMGTSMCLTALCKSYPTSLLENLLAALRCYCSSSQAVLCCVYMYGDTCSYVHVPELLVSDVPSFSTGFGNTCSPTCCINTSESRHTITCIRKPFSCSKFLLTLQHGGRLSSELCQHKISNRSLLANHW